MAINRGVHPVFNFLFTNLTSGNIILFSFMSMTTMARSTERGLLWEEFKIKKNVKGHHMTPNMNVPHDTLSRNNNNKIYVTNFCLVCKSPSVLSCFLLLLTAVPPPPPSNTCSFIYSHCHPVLKLTINFHFHWDLGQVG